MRLIELTLDLGDDVENAVWVNPDEIQSIRVDPKTAATVVTLKSGFPYVVKEAAVEIIYDLTNANRELIRVGHR